MDQAIYAAARDLVLGHYGRACACCGATSDLSIDHVEPCLEGRKRRSAREFYRWLVVHGFPPGFQTLCMPCNRSKRTGKLCKLHGKLPGKLPGSSGLARETPETPGKLPGGPA